MVWSQKRRKLVKFDAVILKQLALVIWHTVNEITHTSNLIMLSISPHPITATVEQLSDDHGIALRSAYTSSRGFHVTLPTSATPSVDDLPPVFIKVTKSKNVYSFTCETLVSSALLVLKDRYLVTEVCEIQNVLKCINVVNKDLFTVFVTIYSYSPHQCITNISWLMKFCLSIFFQIALNGKMFKYLISCSLFIVIFLVFKLKPVPVMVLMY